jgi:hypothetical protein
MLRRPFPMLRTGVLATFNEGYCEYVLRVCCERGYVQHPTSWVFLPSSPMLRLYCDHVATVGEFRETYHPRNVKVNEIRVTSFRNIEHAKVWNLEPAKLWSRERAKIWNLEPAKLRSSELVKTRSHEPATPQNRGSAKFGNLLEVEFGSHGARRFPEWEDSRISKKQSQRRHLKKSGFGVWTSGRLVNVWDVKDIHVRVHTGNIL